MSDKSVPVKCCVVIPAFREDKRIAEVVRQVARHVPAVIVIDDGSDDATSEVAAKAGAVVLRHEVNKGKGAALDTGFEYARKNGFEAVITMDGDGQHEPDDVPRFVETYAQTGMPALVGNRMDDRRNMPFIRRMTNMYMSWLLSRKMGQHVPDTQCGYRLYKVDMIPQVFAQSGRFAAESEILMRISDLGLKIGAVPIKAVYRDEKSKINPLRDAFRFFSMLRDYDRKKRSNTSSK